jgi:hypothetical protein
MRGLADHTPFEKAFPWIVKRGGAVLLSWSILPLEVVTTVREYAKKQGCPLRAPHYTASIRGMRGEWGLVKTGILLLPELNLFRPSIIQELATELSFTRKEKGTPPTIIATVVDEEPGNWKIEAKAAKLASALALPLLRMEGGEVTQVKALQEVTTAPSSTAEKDIKRINHHRAKIGMRPLDPAAAGWSERDLQIEAQRIRRLGNPELEAGRLVGILPDEVFAKVTSHSGFASVVQLLGYTPQTYYSFDRRGSASYFVVTKAEFERLRGVASRARLGRKETWRKTWKMRRGGNPDLDMGEVVRLLPGEVPVKAGSHRAYEQVKRTLGYAPQTYYSFQRRSSAGTYHFFLSNDDYEKVKKIRGVGKWRMKAGESWAQTIRFGRENPEWVDRIPGGLADRYTPTDFDQSALAEGTRVEMEHTSDSRIATEIAMDHLVEAPRYYEKLRKIHHNPEAATKARMLAY